MSQDRSSDTTSAAFPGYGEGAPLDLSAYSDRELAGMRRRIVDGTWHAFAETAARVGHCTRPVRLVGSSTTVDAATGEVVDAFSSDRLPLGVLYRPCGNRRADVCPACSRVYARDTFEMLRAGLVGGKTVPESVAKNPLLFVTFTAPGFGYVHGARRDPRTGDAVGGACRPRTARERCAHGRPLWCTSRHDQDDPVCGAPLCEDCYDWQSAVLFNWTAPELWRRTTNTLRRLVAKRLGVGENELNAHASVQFAKVGEFQTRGLIHFHALVRLEGPDGPGSPASLNGQALADLVEKAAQDVTLPVAPVDLHDVERVMAWGKQIDIRVVRDDGPDNGPVAPAQVAGYLAKYATKDANSLRTPGKPQPHLIRMAATARALSARAIAEDPDTDYRLLGRWSHMLGFRGHFSTKSRRYSITLGRLRRARHRFQQLAERSQRSAERIDVRDLDALLLADDEETTLVVGSWTYQGTGWTRPGDEALSLAAAARAREYAQWRAQERKPQSTTIREAN